MESVVNVIRFSTKLQNNTKYIQAKKKMSENNNKQVIYTTHYIYLQQHKNVI